MAGKEVDFVKWFSELSNKDIAIAGGKGASLAEMYNHKFPIPPGFIITADSYRFFIEKSGLYSNIIRMLDELNVDDTAALDRTSKKIREMMENMDMPSEMEIAIIEAYDVLDVDKKNLEIAGQGAALDILKNSHEPPFVAVRSSATTEDLVDASFAGQQDTYLNVKGKEDLILHVKKCFASLFTSRAIYYRQKKGFPHNKSYLTVVVQKMIDSVKSGVMFSKNPLKDDGNIVIEAVWGLGEGIVSGKISPDHYVVSPGLEVLETKIAEKEVALVRSSSGKTEEVKLTEKRSAQVLTSYEIKRLAQFGLSLEEHYKKPQDIEFAIANDEIFIVQSRPITTVSKKGEKEIGGNVLLNGLGASPGVASGVVKIIYDLEDLSTIKEGDVLVTKMTNPDMVVAMQRAAGIITDEGGITSHAAIVSREMGIPAVVGTKSATTKLKEGDVVTVDGFTGRVIEGKGEERKVEIKQVVPTKTKIKVIVDIPEYAERAAASGVKGVGLVRMEGIIAVSGKHPVWYVKNNKIKDYIASVHNGLKKISAPFDEVWVRSSDVRSDEYKGLEGAPQEDEANPMLGDHGIRFSLKNQEILEAEFKAVKELADEFPNKKFGLMMPQIISASEFREAKRIASDINFPKNVKLGIMVETPAAAIVIEDLCKEGIEFISFGTNDLTQYTLAVDRNNEAVQNLYSEMHPAVLNLIRHVIRICKAYGVETSICGQAGSKPEMAKFLLKEGISSISVNADAAFMVSSVIAEIENSPEYNSKKESYSNESEKKFIGETEKNISDNEKLGNAKIENNTKTQQELDEEALILKALDDDSVPLDEYEPALSGDEGKENTPSLNEAIPVDSSFVQRTYENQQEVALNEEIMRRLHQQKEEQTAEGDKKSPLDIF